MLFMLASRFTKEDSTLKRKSKKSAPKKPRLSRDMVFQEDGYEPEKIKKATVIEKKREIKK